jgi:hypothetical protein
MSGLPVDDAAPDNQLEEGETSPRRRDREIAPPADDLDHGPVLDFPTDEDFLGDEFFIPNLWNDLEDDEKKSAQVVFPELSVAEEEQACPTLLTIEDAEQRYKAMIEKVVDYDKCIFFSRRKKNDQETIEIQRRIEIIMMAIEILQFCVEEEDPSKIPQHIISKRSATPAETLAKAKQMLQDEQDRLRDSVK